MDTWPGDEAGIAAEAERDKVSKSQELRLRGMLSSESCFLSDCSACSMVGVICCAITCRFLTFTPRFDRVPSLRDQDRLARLVASSSRSGLRRERRRMRMRCSRSFLPRMPCLSSPCGAACPVLPILSRQDARKARQPVQSRLSLTLLFSRRRPCRPLLLLTCCCWSCAWLCSCAETPRVWG